MQIGSPIYLNVSLKQNDSMLQIMVGAKSLYISHAVSNFFRTGIEIWPGFVPVCNTEKNGADYGQLLRAVFSCLHKMELFSFS